MNAKRQIIKARTDLMYEDRQDLIDRGELCMEWWRAGDGWKPCAYPPVDRSPLCERHYSMAAATIAAGRKASKR